MNIASAIADVLNIAEPRAKAMAARALRRAWQGGHLAHAFETPMPLRPARPAHPVLIAPGQMPNRRRAGTLASRIAMLHAFAHIEFVAIDLALDVAGRFGAGQPPEFIDDWLDVAADEAMHFAMLTRRLTQLGSHYGSLPAHDGLWEAAAATAHDLAARLAIVPMVLEARGLDVSPATIVRFETAGDQKSAAILNRIYCDEIRHVRIGVKWFERIADSHKFRAPEHWKSLVVKHFRGQLKPPFNDSARSRAGLTREYYDSVAPADAIAQ